jgi:predicted enzyme related to lactoylglutathione lyase
MNITRRTFLKHCTVSAGTLSLTPLVLDRLEAALLSETAPAIIWLHGSGCFAEK